MKKEKNWGKKIEFVEKRCNIKELKAFIQTLLNNQIDERDNFWVDEINNQILSLRAGMAENATYEWNEALRQASKKLEMLIRSIKKLKQ